jgi:predicted dehydrogenase
MARYNAAVRDKLRGTALIGCGGMASHYRSVYAHYPHAPFQLVVDVNAEVAQAVAQELGVARWSTDWHEALTDDIEVVDISTPNHLHEEQAIALLSAGKHVMIQKPLAPSVAACHRIVEAAQKSGASAGVYLSDLEDPAVWDLREMVRQGHFGRVTGVRARYAHRGGLTASPSAWRGSAEKTGGGSFIQLAIHHTNLASWLLGEEITSVMGYAKNLMCENIGGDDTAACVAEFSGGAMGVFESAWNAEGTCFQLYGSEGSVTIHGTEGARIEGRLGKPFVGATLQTDTEGRFMREVVGSKALRGSGGEFDQHIAFLECVRLGKPLLVPAAVGLMDVAVCKAVMRSAETGRRTTIQEILEEAL